MDAMQTPDPRVAVMERIRAAINRHDLDELVDCFHPAVESRQPAHPDRDFSGRDQLRRNWSQILTGAPDLHARLLGCVAEGETVWAEWSWTGTRGAGVAFAMNGVTVNGIRDGRVGWVRFYMEPVQRDGVGVGAAIQAQFESPARP